MRDADQIGISAIVLGELLSGFAAGQRESENRRELGAFLDTARARLLSVEADTAELRSRVYLPHRRKGKLIPTIDLWVSETVLQYGAAVFALDRRYGEVDGLIVGSRLADFLL